jgi:hypothetical protein
VGAHGCESPACGSGRKGSRPKYFWRLGARRSDLARWGRNSKWLFVPGVFQVDAQEKKKMPRGRAKKRMQYNRRFGEPFVLQAKLESRVGRAKRVSLSLQ